MARNPGGSPKARHLGAELRNRREAAKVAAREMAQKLGIPRTRLQRYEAGEAIPSPEEASQYLTEAEVNGSDRDELLDLLRNVDDENWMPSTSGVKTELTTLIEFERTCTQVLEVIPLLIPGLLQTADYTRALMTGMGMEDVDRLVGARLGRQEIITRRKNPVPYTAIIGEWALREPIGGPDVMAEQLRRVAELSQRPNVEVLVLPSRSTVSHAALMGAFIVFEFPKAAPIVHLEHFGSAAFVYAAKGVAAYKRAGEDLRDAALSAEESRSLIAEISTAMEKEDQECRISSA